MILRLIRKVFEWLELGKEKVFYVGGSEILPEPLSPDEEKEALERLAQGDLSAKNLLIERNLRLVAYIARKFEGTGVGIEDLISIGTIGLIKAVNTFKGDKNIKLATYGSRCIENEILMHLRRSNKTKQEISLDEPLNTDWDGNELLLSDILGTDVDVTSKKVEDEDEVRILLNIMSTLSTREKSIMELRFGLNGRDELTQKEVADLLGISQSYISRLEKKILRKLKLEFQKLA